MDGTRTQKLREILAPPVPPSALSRLPEALQRIETARQAVRARLLADPRRRRLLDDILGEPLAPEIRKTADAEEPYRGMGGEREGTESRFFTAGLSAE